MVNVYAWPPVAVVARYWTQEQPVGRSRSLITGSSYVSAAQRKRIVAGVDVAGWPMYSSGYLEALWRLLDGGVHLVRLNSCRIPFGKTVGAEERSGSPFQWTTPPAPIEWTTPPAEFVWFVGVYIAGEVATVRGIPAVTVTGLPPNALVALPGEFVTFHLATGDETHMILAPVQTNSAGAATIRLASMPSASGRVSITHKETGVFEVVSDWPRVMNRNRFPGNYTIEFRQVFEDERGPFTEVDPWN